jgi:hypothetical protein
VFAHSPWALHQTPLTLTYSKAPQPLDVFEGVIAPAARSTTSQRECSEPLPEPEPASAYAKFFGGLSNRERVSLKHAPTLKFADKFG